MTNLGTLGGPQSSPLAMNGSGQVVENSSTVSGYRAFFYDNGLMKYISPSSPAWQSLDAAQAINDSGQIAGFGRLANGATHAFLTVSSSSSADVAVTVSANPTTVVVGSQVTLSVAISNSGPEAATNVAFSGPRRDCPRILCCNGERKTRQLFPWAPGRIRGADQLHL
jgi:probable HAF family extracellular repeat protein